MSTPTRDSPETPLLWSDEKTPPPRAPRPAPPGGGGDHDDDGGSSSRGRRRGRLAVLLTASALLGGGVSAGVVGVTGAFDDGAQRTTTIVQSESSEVAQRDGADVALDAESLYTATSAGVVDITAKGVSSGESSQQGPFGGPAPESEPEATGTGFVIDDEGHIVTAAHVVDGASSITVRFEGGETRRATLLGQDDATDIAVLKVEPSGLTLHPLKLGSSSSLDVGDGLAVIGSPFGYQQSISTGIVSGVDRTIEAPNGFTVAHAIQTDAAMNPGNSGGPILNAAGEVVGIADQIATGGSEQSSGVGFAVPIDLVRDNLDELKAGQAVRHAYLGVSTSSTATSTPGAVIAEVAAGGPADDAKLRAGDVVTSIGGTAVSDSNDLVAAIADHEPGDDVEVIIDRGSQKVELTVKLGTQPKQ